MATVEYDDLSRGRKQEIDLKRRMAAKEAREAAARGPGAGATVRDVAAGISEITRGLDLGAYGRIKPGMQRDLNEAAKKAQARADYEDVRDTSTLRLFDDKAASKEAGERAKAKMTPTRRMVVEDMKKGGSVSSASSRADGCAQRGKTRGKMV
jgi:hypothetical protein